MSAPRHLGYVLKRFPRISETFIAAELIELRRQGERVSVFAVSRPEEDFTHAFLDELDVDVVYLPRRPSRQPLRTVRSAVAALRRNPAGCLSATRSALRRPSVRSFRRLLQAATLDAELRRAGVTHVHAHFASTAARLANLTWQLGGPTYSVTAHAKDIWHGDVRNDALRDKLREARFVATVSEENRRHLQDVLGPGSTVRLVPNSVDLTRLPSPQERAPEPGVVLAVARLVEKKGLDDLVRACGMLRRERVGVRLEIIGEGPERMRLEQLAIEEGADVTLGGALPHEQVTDRYRRAAAVALPCVVADNGDRDGLPTSVLEAMAAGAPVVTTAVNGLDEAVIDGVTGLVVPQRDPIALAAALRRVLDDRQLANRLGRCAHQHVVSHFALTQSSALLRSLFDDVEVA